MIEEKHRVAALMALVDDAELEEVVPPDVWALVLSDGYVARRVEGKKGPGLKLTEVGMAFLRRALL